MQTIHCPHCQHEISLDTVMRDQISSAVQERLQGELAAEKLSQQQAFEKRLQEETKRIQEKNEKEFAALHKQRLSLLEEQLKREQDRAAISEKRELDLLKKEQELQEKERARELEVARTLAQEREKIRARTTQEVLQLQHQKELEKDKQIADLKRLTEELQRKANQGSQQTQGEVLELELERQLHEAFPDDLITPVAKGVHGADISQTVRSSKGTECGVILWESKQTKTWSEAWIGKLKADARAAGADITILVTAAYKEPNWNGISPHDGVWVCSKPLSIPLALALRKSLLDVGRERAIALHRGEKADHLYTYVTSVAFRQQLEAIVEVTRDMHEQIQTERRAMEKIWKMREMQGTRAIQSLAGIYGSIQGIAGTSAVPELRGLSLLEEGEIDSS